MNSYEVFDAIAKIAYTASKNDKLALLGEYIQDPLFKRVCEYTYNPFKTFGLRQLPLKVAFGDYTFNEHTWYVLDRLISRELSGHDALNEVTTEINMLEPDSARLFQCIIRKNLLAGFSESSLNKVCKGLIPEFAYMRCSLPKDTDLEKWPWSEGVFSQEKADGMFANLDYESNGDVSIRSRQGTEFPMEAFAPLVDEVKKVLHPDFEYHGEFLVRRDGAILPRAESNGVMNRVINGGVFEENEKPLFLIWDMIRLKFVEPKGRYELSYRTRYETLFRMVPYQHEFIGMVPTKVVRSLAEAKMHAVEFMKAGKEGSVIKRPDAIWRDGTSKEQVKIKLEFEVDLEIVAVVPGNVGTKNEGRTGSLRCKSSDGCLLVDVTVKNEKMRDSVDANPAHWIGGIIGVVANDIETPSESNMNHSLFLPRMAEDCLRDKAVADDLERVFAQKRAAIYGEEMMKETSND